MSATPSTGIVLTLLASHQAPADLQRVLDIWLPIAGEQSLVVAYGGSRDAYERVSFSGKFYVSDPRLRTRDHQRERQSAKGILDGCVSWMKSFPSFEYVHFVEYDQLPLVADLNTRLVERLMAERADILAFQLQRIDRTSHPHYLYHVLDAEFARYLQSISRRDDKGVVLSMFGGGSFWRRDAFEAVAALEEPVPIYNEVWLPTVAHHLGYRLRDFAEQNEFISGREDFTSRIAAARAAGAWTIHPVKVLPEGDLAAR